MEKKQVGLETVMSISGQTLMVVAQTSVCTWQNNVYPSFCGLKKPLYLLAKETSGKITAFDLEGHEVALEVILTRYPELKTYLST